MKQLRVRDRAMLSHDACTSGTSQVLTIASLQRLKMEALIPAPTDSEVQSVMKFLNAQSIAAIEIRQMSQVHGHTQLNGQHIFCKSSAIAQALYPVISIFSYTSRNSCPVRVSVFQNNREVEMSVTVVPVSGGRLL